MKGKTLGSRYKVIEYIAKGGFGRTYLAADTQLPGKDTCVVKQLNPNTETPKLLEVARRLFKAEASALHNLGNHDQIPQLLAYFEEEEKFYLVQQYIEGLTLKEEIIPEQVWTEAQVIEFLRDGLNILDFIHSKGVIHRDVKPENLIRRHADGKIVLVDFGTVKQVVRGQTNLAQLTVPVGTQGYMPIEQARGKPRPASDIYALGIIGIEVISGTSILDLEEDEEGEIIWEFLASVSTQLAKILTKMTRYHFQDRYQSAAEVLQALQTLSDEPVIQLGAIVDLPSSPSEATEINHSDLPGVPAKRLENQSVRASNFNQTNSYDTIESNPSQNVSLERFTVSNELDATFAEPAIKSQPVTGKSGKQKIVTRLVALLVVVLGGVYVLIQQFASEPSQNQINPEELPDYTTPRVDQGEGFRRDL